MSMDLFLAADPVRQELPLRIALRLPVLAARVERDAARFLRERHGQQAALDRPAGEGEALGHLEVLPRLLVIPGLCAWRQLLQPKRRATLVADDAACVPRPLLEEERLN